ncbi:hypothetical protein HDU67_004504, partial [Dinochytrium kinnereticum]
SAEFKAEHAQTLKQFIEVYPFADLNVNTPAGLFPNKVDIVAEIDKLVADASVTTQMEFSSRINLLVASLQDAHFSYTLGCVSNYFFYQPWHMAAVFAEGSTVPQIKLVDTVPSVVVPFWVEALGGEDVASFVNYTVKSVDGVDALKSVQDFADTFSGFARSGESRFNRVLYKRVFRGGEFTNSRGPYYFTDFLGSSASPNRTYVLTPPNGGADVTVSIPWAAIFMEQFSDPDAPIPFRSTLTYENLFCKLLPESSLRRRALDGATHFDRPNAIEVSSHRPITAADLAA